MARLEQRQAFEAVASSPEGVLGKVLRGMAETSADQRTAEVVIIGDQN